MDTSTIIQIAGYLISFGCCYGMLSTKLEILSKRMDKHNNLIERQYISEGKIDGIEHQIESLQSQIKMYHGGEK